MNILISEIENSDEQVKVLNFSEIIEEFNTEIPVEAKLQVEVLGTAIKDDYEGNCYIADDHNFDYSNVDSSYDVRYYIWLKTQKEANATMSIVISDELT